MTDRASHGRANSWMRSGLPTNLYIAPEHPDRPRRPEVTSWVVRVGDPPAPC